MESPNYEDDFASGADDDLGGCLVCAAFVAALIVVVFFAWASRGCGCERPTEDAAGPWPALPAIGYLPMPKGEAPPPLPPCQLSDLSRFPDYPTACAALASIRAHLRWLDAEIAIAPKDRVAHLWAIKCEVVALEGPWEKLRFVTMPSVGPVSSLEELREMIGARAYYCGEMPGPRLLRCFRPLPSMPQADWP